VKKSLAKVTQKRVLYPFCDTYDKSPPSERAFAFLTFANHEGCNPLAGLGLHIQTPPLSGVSYFRTPLVEDEKLSLLSLVKVEGAKVAPMGGGLLIYGLTYQEWTIRLMAAYALFLVLDGVGRRWVYPLVKFAWARLRKRDQVPADPGGQK
jgi:hypothetical protein